MSFKRALLRQQKKEQEKLARIKTAVFTGDNSRMDKLQAYRGTVSSEAFDLLMDDAYRLDTADKLMMLGIPEDMAQSLVKGFERTVEEELNSRMDALMRAMEETVVILESQVCKTNIILFLRAVEKTFGNLKTVQKGWQKLIENYSAAVEEAEQIGMLTLSKAVDENTGLDYEVEDIDYGEVYKYWETAILTAKALGQVVKDVPDDGVRLVDLNSYRCDNPMLLKAFRLHESQNPVGEITLDRKWDVILEKQGDGFVTKIRHKEAV